MENTYFKVGQKAYTLMGESIVEKSNDSSIYPFKIFVGGRYESFTHDGRLLLSGTFVSVFQNPIITTPNVPLLEFEPNELVWVSDDKECWYAQYLIRYESGLPLCTDLLKKPESTLEWKYIQKYDTHPLLKK